MSSKRILAHRVLLDGCEYALSVLTLSRLPDGRWSATVSPFEGETPATTFHSGTAALAKADGTPWHNGDNGEPQLLLR